MLEKDFISNFKVFYLIWWPFCMRKYKLNKNHIISTTKIDIVAVIFGNIVMYIFLFLTLQNFSQILGGNLTFYIYCITYFLYALNHNINSVLNIINSQIQLNIVHKLQEIDSFLYDERDTLKLKYFVRGLTITLFLIYVPFLSVKISIDPLWFWARGVFISLTLYFELEVIYTAFVVYFLACKTKKWTEHIRNTRRLKFAMKYKRGETEKELMLSTFVSIINTVTCTKNTSQFVVGNPIKIIRVIFCEFLSLNVAYNLDYFLPKNPHLRWDLRKRCYNFL